MRDRSGNLSGDLSVTALYTSAAWRWGGLPHADLLDHSDARRVFGVVNAALGVARPFVGGGHAPLRVSLLHRHVAIDHVVRAARRPRILELAAGLSRRGLTFSEDATVDYVEVDRPAVLEAKRALLSRTAEGRRALARPNLRLLGADVIETPLAELSPPDGRPLAVIAEGLLMYLQVEAQRSLVGRVRERLADGGGTFVFDLVPPREQPPPGLAGRGLGWLMKRFTGGQGFAPDPRSREEIADDVRACGFADVEILEPRRVAREWGLPHPEANTQQLVFVAHTERPAARASRAR